MEKGLFSVIVPVYNVEAYIKQCVESVAKQIYPKMELILVDDGSTDASGKLCDEYVKGFFNARVIHQENKGLAAARNAGLLEAKGEYICFLDADDHIEKELLSKTAYYLEQGDEMVSFGAKKVDELGRGIYDLSFESALMGSYSLNEDNRYDFLYGKLLQYKVGWEACFTVYQAEFLKKHQLLFDENLRFAEDKVFTIHCFLKATRYRKIPDRLYDYVSRSGSLTKSHREENPLFFPHENYGTLSGLPFADPNDPNQEVLYYASIYYYCKIFLKTGSMDELQKMFQGAVTKYDCQEKLAHIKSHRTYLIRIFGKEEGQKMVRFFENMRKACL